MAGAERVSLQIADGVADVRLNRPDKLNALDLPMIDALVEAGERLRADASLRAVVLSGEGRAFCAGLDVAALQGLLKAGPAGSNPDDEDPGDEVPGVGPLFSRPAGRITNHAQHAAYTWHELPVPVVAAVTGEALGGGLQIAMAADIRLVAPDARLSVLEIRWGLVPDMTGTWTLPLLVGRDVAKELTWTGRTVGGEEAVRLGLATRVAADPRAEALELAAELAAKSPHALRAAKRLLNRSGSAPPAQQFVDESREMAALVGSPNQLEAASAYLARRAPAFSDPAGD